MADPKENISSILETVVCDCVSEGWLDDVRVGLMHEGSIDARLVPELVWHQYVTRGKTCVFSSANSHVGTV